MDNADEMLTLFGAAVRERRMELRWSQTRLAAEAMTSQNAIYLLEHGLDNPSIRKLWRIAEALRCELSLVMDVNGSEIASLESFSISK